MLQKEREKFDGERYFNFNFNYSKELENKLKHLVITIDEEGARKAVSDITETDYFKRLKEEAAGIRKKNKS